MLNKQLNSSFLSRCLAPKTSLAFIIFVSLIFISACGKRTPPLPPIEKTALRTEISGYQQGNRINLIWNAPPRDSSAFRIERIDIYRLAEPLSSTVQLTEEEFASRSTLIASVPVQDNAASGLSEKQVFYTDTLEFAGQAVRLRYAVRLVNSSGQKAAFSNFLLMEPTARVAEAPDLKEAAVAQNEILLKWQPPPSNIDATRPANILGYNVYRTDARGDRAETLNSAPVTRGEYADRNFEFGTRYRYFVRAVSLGANGEPIESLDSNTIEIIPKDTFPPSRPEALTIAAAPGAVSIFFAPNPERDIAGYRVYRSEDSDAPKSQWQRLMPELLPANTFQDTKVQAGKTYFYFVTAVDKYGNESEASEIVSETIP
jgi:fibronectin type 3 domain-containing protein